MKMKKSELKDILNKDWDLRRDKVKKRMEANKGMTKEWRRRQAIVEELLKHGADKTNPELKNFLLNKLKKQKHFIDIKALKKK